MKKPSADCAIACHDLSKCYGGRTVLDRVSFTVPWGALVAVTGPSGSGKSTLLRILGGLDSDFKGSVRCAGRELRDAADASLDAYRLDEVGFVFQELNLIDHLSALDNVACALTLRGTDAVEAHREAARALAEVGLEEKAACLPRELSGGERQRVAVARAIARNPSVILADEPTGSLDPSTGAEIAALLAQCAERGCAVVVVTHDRPLFEPLAASVVSLEDGVVGTLASAAMLAGAGTGAGAASAGVATLATSAAMPAGAAGTLAGAGAAPTAASVAAPAVSATSATEVAAAGAATGRRSGRLRAVARLALSHMRARFKRCLAAASVCAVGVLGLGLMIALLMGMQTYSDTLQRRILISVPVTVTPQLLAEGEPGEGVDAPHGSDAVDAGAIAALAAGDLTSDGTGRRFVAAQTAVEREGALAALQQVLEAKCADGDLRGVQSIQPIYPYANDVAVRKGEQWVLLGSSTSLALLEDAAAPWGAEVAALAGSSAEGDVFFRPLVSNGKEGLEYAYRLVAGRYPASSTEIVLVTRSDGTVSDALLIACGLASAPEVAGTVSVEELFAVQLVLLEGCDQWVRADGSWRRALPGTELFDEVVDQGIPLSVVGVCAPRYPVDDETELSYFGYEPALMDEVAAHVAASAAVRAQQAGALEAASAADQTQRGGPLSRRLADLAEERGFSQGKVDALEALTDEQVEALACAAGTTASAIEQGSWNPDDRMIRQWRSLSDAVFIGRIEALVADGVQGSASLDWYGPQDMEQLQVFVRTLDDRAEVLAAIARFNDSRIQMGLAPVEVAPAPEVDLIEQTLRVMDIILLALGTLSFLVVFATTASTMATFAAERRSEVGCLRSMGASRLQVVFMFLLEAVVLGSLAWAIGSLGVFACAALISDAVAEAIAWQGLITYTLPCALAVFAVTTMVAACAAVAPAKRAAEADPFSTLSP